jgi:hypothetical protein
MHKEVIRINITNEEALEQGAMAVGEMLSELGTYLARRSQRKCIICLKDEWMDPGERICWKCSRCSEALKVLSHRMTKRSCPEHRALREVVTWMEDVPCGQERSPQEIQNHLDELRASYTWSSNGQYTKQHEYQDWVQNFLLTALHDMNLFFRRLGVVRAYYNQLATNTERDRQLPLWKSAETNL